MGNDFGLHTLTLTMIIAVLWAMLWVAPAFAASDGWILRWERAFSDTERHAEISRLGYSEKKYYPLSNVSWVYALSGQSVAPDTRFEPNVIFEVPSSVSHSSSKSTRNAAPAFESPRVSAAASALASTLTPTDPPFTNAALADDLAAQYMNLPTAWTYNTGSSDVRIAVLSTGIDTSHTDLDANIAEAVEFVTGDTFAGDKNGHGTNRAALIAAEANNALGIAGVCWTCKIVSVKVIGDSGFGSTADAAEGIRWAAQNNVKIMLLSFTYSGTTDPGSTLSSAVQYAYDQGVLLIGQAGDNNQNSMEYPARYDQTFAVGAIDPSSGERWSNSNYKDGLELMAPGVGIFSDSLSSSGNQSVGDGTFFAAAFVAGVAGLIWSEQPSLTRQEVTDRLNSTAKDLNTPGWDETTGFGCVDAAAALRVAAFKQGSGQDVISFPNPFRVRAGGNVTIRPAQDVGTLTVKLYSLDGRLLRTLVGSNEVAWDGKTGGGQTVAAGMYLYQASAYNLKDEGRIAVIDW